MHTSVWCLRKKKRKGKDKRERKLIKKKKKKKKREIKAPSISRQISKLSHKITHRPAALLSSKPYLLLQSQKTINSNKRVEKRSGKEDKEWREVQFRSIGTTRSPFCASIFTTSPAFLLLVAPTMTSRLKLLFYPSSFPSGTSKFCLCFDFSCMVNFAFSNYFSWFLWDIGILFCIFIH